LPLVPEFVVFPNPKAGALQLAKLKLHQIQSRGSLSSIHLSPRQLLAELPDVFEVRGDTRHAIVECPPRIEQRQMLSWIEKLLMFMLSMKLDERAGKRSEIAGGRQCAIDERSTAALRRDLSAHDELFAVTGLEDRFDRREILAGPDQILSRSATQQQTNCANENRLAGPRLPCQNVERLFKLDRDRLDHRKIADGEEADHAGGASCGRGGAASGTAIVSWV
jgi:hypothetical protein